MRLRWRARIQAVEADGALLAGEDGAHARVPAEWLPAGVRPGDPVDVAVRLRRLRPLRDAGSESVVTRHAPWLDTLSLVALAVGVAALVYHLLVNG